MKFMKNTIIFLTLCFSNLFSQEFSLNKEGYIKLDKKNLSILTEIFFLENCKNCKIVSNIIDDENTILSKCSTIQKVYYDSKDIRFTYSYDLFFVINNESYKIIISNIKCVSTFGDKDIDCIDINSEHNYFLNIDFESYNYIIRNLKSELEAVLKEYELFLLEQFEKIKKDENN